VSSRRRSRSVVAAVFCVVCFRANEIAQTPQAPPPAFRSTVDLLTIDTAVRGKSGQVVADLRPSDFTVTVDGKPRKVVSAVFFQLPPADAARLNVSEPPPQYVSNDEVTPGRVVILAVDSRTVRPGQEPALVDVASRILDRLSPSDAVGVVELPGHMSDPTLDRSLALEVVKRFKSRAATEAEVKAAGSALQATARANAGQLLLNLTRFLRETAAVRAPRSVILLSGGLVFDRDLLGGFNELTYAVALSRVALFPILLAPEGEDPETPGAKGLATIASMTGGMFFQGISRDVGTFDRINSAVSSFYQLAIEGNPADADGKQRDVKVRVNREAVDVRAPTHLAVAKPPRIAASRDSLLLALQQPTEAREIPLAVSTYSTHGNGGAVRVLVSAEIGASNAPAPTEWGVVITQNGRSVMTRRGRIPAGPEHPRTISTTLELPPGAYRLRLAAVDADDRLGVLEIPITARFRTMGDAILSDLIVGVATGGEIEPRRRVGRSEDLMALLEGSAGASRISGGVLHLTPAGSADSVQDAPFSIRPRANPASPVTLEARLPLAKMPAGRYTASVTLEIAGTPWIGISRIVEIK
jgi:VWFA-related protein